jgi:hypothetical protein
MTLDDFKDTPIHSKMMVKYKGKLFLLLGLNWLSGTIRLKGQHENLNADFSECEYVKK